ncbi:MAG: hypothetical protein ACM31C_24200 [Acidobacteriota bacterium]
MRSPLVLAIVLASAPVLAEPVTTPSPCSVDVVRAPDDARKIVEAWLATTRRCTISLEVRIVETKGGLYVIARDDRGTVRDRIVADAQTAGALVASWADDGQPGPVAVDARSDVQLVPAPVESREPPSLEPIVDPTGGPGASPLQDVGETGVPARAHQWVGEFLLFGGNKSSFHGLRAEVDVLHRSRWNFGVALAIASDQRSANDGTTLETQGLNDYGATLYVARPIRASGWELRPAVGVGVVYTRAYEVAQPAPYGSGGFVAGGIADYVRVSPFAEASLLASHGIVGNLAVSAGAVLTAYGQHLEAMLPDLQQRDFAALAVAGLRFGFL